MNNAAVISGSLVDAKNVNTHKVMRLIIDVPAENALKVIAAFGWPTMVNPVSVAVARLNDTIRTTEARHGSGGDPVGLRSSDDDSHRHGEISAKSRPDQSVDVPAGAEKPKKSPAQIAGFLCTLPLFHKFLQEKFREVWFDNYLDDDERAHSAEKIAAECVRDICTVGSRADLTDKNIEWNALLLAFRFWENHPELEDA